MKDRKARAFLFVSTLTPNRETLRGGFYFPTFSSRLKQAISWKEKNWRGFLCQTHRERLTFTSLSFSLARPDRPAHPSRSTPGAHKRLLRPPQRRASPARAGGLPPVLCGRSEQSRAGRGRGSPPGRCGRWSRLPATAGDALRCGGGAGAERGLPAARAGRAPGNRLRQAGSPGGRERKGGRAGEPLAPGPAHRGSGGGGGGREGRQSGRGAEHGAQLPPLAWAGSGGSVAGRSLRLHPLLLCQESHKVRLGGGGEGQILPCRQKVAVRFPFAASEENEKAVPPPPPSKEPKLKPGRSGSVSLPPPFPGGRCPAPAPVPPALLAAYGRTGPCGAAVPSGIRSCPSAGLCPQPRFNRALLGLFPNGFAQLLESGGRYTSPCPANWTEIRGNLTITSSRSGWGEGVPRLGPPKTKCCSTRELLSFSDVPTESAGLSGAGAESRGRASEAPAAGSAAPQRWVRPGRGGRRSGGGSGAAQPGRGQSGAGLRPGAGRAASSPRLSSRWLLFPALLCPLYFYWVLLYFCEELM